MYVAHGCPAREGQRSVFKPRLSGFRVHYVLTTQSSISLTRELVQNTDYAFCQGP